MDKALVIIGAPGYNRGSEILLTGILEILKKSGKYESDVTAFALRKEWEEDNKELYGQFLPRETPYNCFWYKLCNNIGIRLIKKFGYTNTSVWFMRQALCKAFSKYQLIVFVGADNFDYQYTQKNELNCLIALAKKVSSAKIAILDCSIAKENINKFFIENLRQADIVTARDTMSYNNLKEHRKDVILHADPAFLVAANQGKVDIDMSKQYIGINVSPLVQKMNEKIQENVLCLIDWILENTTAHILLIPHVMKMQDYSILEEIKRVYEKESRVLLLEDDKYSARELKYIISKCEAFVGARTHSMVAAYSQGVPALGIGYSIKSTGIAKDLLKEDIFCIQAEDITGTEDIKELFIQLWNDRVKIREKLQLVLPEYTETLKKLEEVL